MILFRLVTQRPLRRESFVGECLTQSDRDLLRGSCEGRAEIADLVLSCLSEVRKDRMTAKDVRDALVRMSDGEATAVESSSSPAETEKDAPGEWSDRGIDRSQTVVTENAAETNAISSMVATLQSGPSLTVVMGILVLAILGTVTWLVLEDGGGEGVTAPEHSERVAEPTKSPEEAAMDSPEPEGKESTAGNAEESEWTRTVRIESKPVSLVFERGGKQVGNA